MNRLTWTTGPYASYQGRAGSVELFGIHYRTRKEEPVYSLSTQLPGLHGQWKDDSADVLKDRAEQLLDAWLTEIGAFA